MKLYFAPFACSLAVRIVAHETKQTIDYVLVRDCRLPHGSSFLDVNPLGYVPVLETSQGRLLEASAILQFLAERAPDNGLAPKRGTFEHYLMLQWLSFVATELHKTVFSPLLSSLSSDEERASARRKAESRLKFVSDHLDGREHLGGAFSLADAYLFAVLNWSEAVAIDLAQWPALLAYRERLKERPAVARAMGEELPLLQR